MDGGKTQQLIDSGIVGVFPLISSCIKGIVYFSNGVQKQYSAIILATGYAPNLQLISHMCGKEDLLGIPMLDGFKVRSSDGLYLLGFDNIYDHRSRYLRGIRVDAKRLAKLL